MRLGVQRGRLFPEGPLRGEDSHGALRIFEEIRKIFRRVGMNKLLLGRPGSPRAPSSSFTRGVM